MSEQLNLPGMGTLRSSILEQDACWVDGTGFVWLLEEMATSHLANVEPFLLRHGEALRMRWALVISRKHFATAPTVTGVLDGRLIELVVREEDEQGFGRNVLEVTVRHDSRFGNAAEVNWASIGSVAPDTARTYSRMINRAADLAYAINDGEYSVLGQEATFAFMGGTVEPHIIKVGEF